MSSNSILGHPLKCLLVGSGAVGELSGSRSAGEKHVFLCSSIPQPPPSPQGKKSCLLTYTNNTFPTDPFYLASSIVHNPLEVDVNVDQNISKLQLWNPRGGVEELDRIRPLSYPRTDVFLIAFSGSSHESFAAVREKWIVELKQHLPEVPILLVGMRCDLRKDEETMKQLAEKDLQMVTVEEAQKCAREIGAKGYYECSALTQEGLKLMFDDAIRAARVKVASEPKKTKKDCTIKNSTSSAPGPIQLQCIGDALVGKSDLLHTYFNQPLRGEIGASPTPHLFDTHSVSITLDERKDELILQDTKFYAYELEQIPTCLRILSYQQTSLFLLCFAIDSRTTFERVRTRWILELRKYVPHIPIMLIGTKGDLRSKIEKEGDTSTSASSSTVPPVSLITPDEANALAAEISAVGYSETSCVTLEGVKNMYDEAVRAVRRERGKLKSKKKTCTIL